MSNWAYIENNVIIDTFDSLPMNWRNVSNLSASENNVDFLKSLGWYPIEKNFVQHNPSVQRLIYGPIEFDGTRVYQNNIVENISTSELYNSFITELRTKRNELLKESDFMCLIDIILMKGSNWVNDIANYRQQLRDLPSTYVNNGTIYSIFEINWPTKPNINDYPNITLDSSKLFSS